MAFTYVQVVGQWRDSSGNPAKGTVTAVPSVAFTNSGVTISGPISVAITSGQATLTLAATNDTGTTPTGVTYTFYVQLPQQAEQIIGPTILPNTVSPISLNSQLPWPPAVGAPPGILAPVSYATTAALPANTYFNGTSGLGATLTGNAWGLLSVDGQALQANQRILVKNEGTQANNGVYTVTQPGSANSPYILTRSGDLNSSMVMGPGILVVVKGASGVIGTTNDATRWLSASVMPFTVGTTAITFGAG